MKLPCNPCPVLLQAACMRKNCGRGRLPPRRRSTTHCRQSMEPAVRSRDSNRSGKIVCFVEERSSVCAGQPHHHSAVLETPSVSHVSRILVGCAPDACALGALVPSGCIFTHRPNTLPQCTSHCAFIIHATLATLASTGCLLELWAIHRACICSRELRCCSI